MTDNIILVEYSGAFNVATLSIKGDVQIYENFLNVAGSVDRSIEQVLIDAYGISSEEIDAFYESASMIING